VVFKRKGNDEFDKAKRTIYDKSDVWREAIYVNGRTEESIDSGVP